MIEIPRLEIQPGMLIYQHGGVFAVREAYCLLAEHSQTKGEPIMVNRCEFIADHDSRAGRGCSIPMSWRHDWNAQGNRLAGPVAQVGSVWPRVQS